MKNAISWFEIPATDLARAQQFYEAIFNIRMQVLDVENLRMRLFPVEQQGIGGSLIEGKGFYNPSAMYGPLVYLNANPDLQQVLDRVEAAGGTILIPKTQISPAFGYMAAILDSENNRIALHSLG